MIIRNASRLARGALSVSRPCRRNVLPTQILPLIHRAEALQTPQAKHIASQCLSFHSTSLHPASSAADEIMENLTDLYSTAKDEFEIAAEETEKKTVYAADDRSAAKEAFVTLKEAYQEAVKESNEEVGKEIQQRVGQRIRELQNALTALEESAMED